MLSFRIKINNLLVCQLYFYSLVVFSSSFPFSCLFLHTLCHCLFRFLFYFLFVFSLFKFLSCFVSVLPIFFILCAVHLHFVQLHSSSFSLNLFYTLYVCVCMMSSYFSTQEKCGVRYTWKFNTANFPKLIRSALPSLSSFSVSIYRYLQQYNNASS